jgi:isoquinoline 1-oxidoreductase subunit beta
LYGAITRKDGKVKRSAVDGCWIRRIDDMPALEVHVVPSSEAPTGVGEPGVAPIGPAVANATLPLAASAQALPRAAVLGNRIGLVGKRPLSAVNGHSQGGR